MREASNKKYGRDGRGRNRKKNTSKSFIHVENLRRRRKQNTTTTTMTMEESLNQMSLMAGSTPKISGDNNSVPKIDSRRHIDFDVDGNENGTNNFDQDQVVLSKSTSSTGADYYARGSAEAATESALTLAKIQHVSSMYAAPSFYVFSLVGLNTIVQSASVSILSHTLYSLSLGIHHYISQNPFPHLSCFRGFVSPKRVTDLSSF